MEVYTLTHFGGGRKKVLRDGHIQNRSSNIMSAVAAPSLLCMCWDPGRKTTLRHVNPSTLLVIEKYTLYNIRISESHCEIAWQKGG
jgi:hypothetical protein